ncbi:MAG: hypothetical protein AAGE52_13070 [Myxococcota bacterium]
MPGLPVTLDRNISRAVYGTGLATSLGMRAILILLLLGCTTSADPDLGDSAMIDAATNDADPRADAGEADAGETDASEADAGPRADAGETDAGETDTGSDAESDAGAMERPDPLALEGYGAVSVGGAGGDRCMVTTLANDGPGSLRACIDERTGTGESVVPRIIEFAIGGTILLESDIVIDEPYLTIDGYTAPAPGITIVKRTMRDGEMIIAGRRTGLHPHDLIVRYLRFDGVWDGREEHDQNTATITIDGENNPEGVYRVVLDHLAFVRASDGSPDFWGNVRDVTLSWSLLHHSLHPTTISHSGTEQTRERISLHHNVYAYNHERNPQVRGRVRNLDIVNDVVFAWRIFGGGYGIRLRERGSVVPTDVSLVGNFFASDEVPGSALLLSPTDYPGDVYLEDNVFPVGRDEDFRTVETPPATPPEAGVTRYPVDELAERMLPYVGLPVRTEEEEATFAAIAAAMSR